MLDVTLHQAQRIVQRERRSRSDALALQRLVLEWLLKAGSLARRLGFPPREQSCLLQYPPNARRTDGHNVTVEHHERQPPIAFQPILQMEIDDRFFLPQLQPEIAENPTVVLVDATVTLPPVVELAGGHAQPMNESSDADLGLLRPAPDEIHNLVPHVMRYPVAG